MAKPTELTYKALRNLGIAYAKTEYWNPFARQKYDLFGFIDCIALMPKGIVAIQICGPGTLAAHRKAILKNPDAEQWLKSGGIINIYYWRKLKNKRGQKLVVWKLKVEEIFLESFKKH